MALAGLGLLLAPASSTESATTTTLAPISPSSPSSGPWWFAPSETRIGPTAILLDGIDFEEGQVVVRYELRDIAPTALGRVLAADEINPFFAIPHDDPIAAPERWVLETVDGEIEGMSENTRVRAARFDVPTDFVLGTITGLRVESYRMRMPYVYEIEAAPVAGSEVVLDDGFSFTIRAVLPQAESVIFQVDSTTPSDSFTAGEPTPAIIRGIGTQWESYNQRQFEGLQLILGSTEVPDPFLLEVRTTYWVPFETSISFDLGGAVG
jgi:hypothetical protein